MTNRTWHKGPPPHVGWWNARDRLLRVAWRWWNGENWSLFAHQWDSADLAERCALMRSKDAAGIEWTDYWPENARVPRIDPDAS